METTEYEDGMQKKGPLRGQRRVTEVIFWKEQKKMCDLWFSVLILKLEVEKEVFYGRSM